MPETNDWNERIIAEFRVNDGRVGGRFEGALIVLVHHKGRKSGAEYVHPRMYMAWTGTRTSYTAAAGWRAALGGGGSS